MGKKNGVAGKFGKKLAIINFFNTDCRVFLHEEIIIDQSSLRELHSVSKNSRFMIN